MTDYWPWFVEYEREEIRAGGPDPQIAVVATALQTVDDAEAVFRAGMFANAYTVAGGAAQWGATQSRGRDAITVDWLNQHATNGVPTRRERRAVWSREKFVRAHQSWIRWTDEVWPTVRSEPYPVVFDAVQDHAAFFGRYAAMKVLEVLYRRGVIDHGQSDIRPAGARFPRRTLARLHPDYYELMLEKRETREVRDVAGKLGVETQARLSDELGHPVSWYDVETLLCTFRQALTGKYPGRSQDRELAFWQKAETYWGHDGALSRVLPFYEIRSRVFAPDFLGEVGGWTGARPELETEWKARYPDAVAY